MENTKTLTGTEEVIVLKDGVSAKVEGSSIEISGKLGSVKRVVDSPLVYLSVDGNNVKVLSKKLTKKSKALVKTWAAHVKNMIKGVTEGHSYELKICASHFPMNVSVSGKDFIVKNFLGEKVPRKLVLKEGVKVVVDGQAVKVESINKELAGQVAADIEQLCRITNRDRRRFQDGIYIINKDGKQI